MSLNVATLLREAVLAEPDKACLILGDEEVTYADLDARSARFAAGLLDLGLERGDAVAVQLGNSAEFVAVYVAIMRAGLVMVPMNPLLREQEVTHLLTDSGARVLLTSSEHTPEMVRAAGDRPVYVAGNPPAPLGCRALDELCAPTPFLDIVPTSSEDTAVLLYTSGTTGRPKGAQLTHLQLVFNAINSGALFGFGRSDVSLAVVPFFHVYGLSLINVAIRYVSTITVMERFDATAALTVMERDRVSIMFGVPTMYHALLAHAPDDLDLPVFRMAVSGGAALPGRILRQVEERFGVLLLEGYGLSESCATATFNRSAQDRRFLSIGKPIWGVEVVVVDEDGRRLPRGAEHIGELVMRGHNVMKGYHNDPEATALALRDGWLHTGDLGYEDEDGFLFVVDRTKDLIIRGGYNVYPREIEEVLYSHPGISEAAVIGRPDERLGEEVVAVVVASPGEPTDEAAVIAFCRERLAAYKYPREVRFVPALPKGPTGKILKKELR